MVMILFYLYIFWNTLYVVGMYNAQEFFSTRVALIVIRYTNQKTNTYGDTNTCEQAPWAMAAPSRRVAVTILIRVTIFDDNNDNDDNDKTE